MIAVPFSTGTTQALCNAAPGSLVGILNHVVSTPSPDKWPRALAYDVEFFKLPTPFVLLCDLVLNDLELLEKLVKAIFKLEQKKWWSHFLILILFFSWWKLNNRWWLFKAVSAFFFLLQAKGVSWVTEVDKNKLDDHCESPGPLKQTGHYGQIS